MNSVLLPCKELLQSSLPKIDINLRGTCKTLQLPSHDSFSYN